MKRPAFLAESTGFLCRGDFLRAGSGVKRPAFLAESTGIFRRELFTVWKHAKDLTRIKGQGRAFECVPVLDF